MVFEVCEDTLDSEQRVREIAEAERGFVLVNTSSCSSMPNSAFAPQAFANRGDAFWGVRLACRATACPRGVDLSP